MTTGAPAAEAGGREPGDDRESGVTSGWHFVAFVAAMALFLTLAIDWYTTEQGEEYRRVQEANERSDRPQLDSQDVERAEQAAEAQEKNAWQADAFVDRLILLACLAAFLAAVAAALLRSMGRTPDPPWRPSALATVFGVIGLLLILYRMVQPPGFNDAAVVKAGAPIGLASIGILTVASRLATLVEREERGELAPPREDRAERRARRRERKPRPVPAAAAPPPAAPPPAPATAPADAEPKRPAPLWAPSTPASDDPFGPIEDPSAEAREARRRAREQARERRDRPS